MSNHNIYYVKALYTVRSRPYNDDIINDVIDVYHLNGSFVHDPLAQGDFFVVTVVAIGTIVSSAVLPYCIYKPIIDPCITAPRD